MLAATSKSNQNGYFCLSLQLCVTQDGPLFFYFNMSNTVTLEGSKSAQFLRAYTSMYFHGRRGFGLLCFVFFFPLHGSSPILVCFSFVFSYSR